jgi:hypothetical protein
MFSQYCRDASNNSATTNEGEFVILLKQDVCTNLVTILHTIQLPSTTTNPESY